MSEKSEQSKDETGLKTPPPKEYTTARGNAFVFGKPALKHRKIIVRVLKLMQEPAADYEEIIKCAKARKMSVGDFVKLPEDAFTEEEKRAIIKQDTPENKLKFADMMSEILTEVLYATIKEAPFQFDTIDDLESKMDDWSEAVELFPIAVKWVALAALDLKNIDRKNL